MFRSKHNVQILILSLLFYLPGSNLNGVNFGMPDVNFSLFEFNTFMSRNFIENPLIQSVISFDTVVCLKDFPVYYFLYFLSTHTIIIADDKTWLPELRNIS